MQYPNQTPTPQQNTVMCVLAYLSILSLIPFFAEKNDPFVQYHAKQGVNLFILEVIIGVLCGILMMIPFIGFIGSILQSLCGLGFLALSILGIVNACQGQMKPLPVVSSIQFVK